MKSLSESKFKDLYLGEAFADVTGLSESNTVRTEAPREWEADITLLRARCVEARRAFDTPEFSIDINGVLHRVTHVPSLNPFGVYILRRSELRVRDASETCVPDYVIKAATAETTKGLILVVGEPGVGKTTTAISLTIHRLKTHGGFALGIEDPIETMSDGVHGMGRMISVPANRLKGGYTEQLLLALRSGPDFIFLGEIRDSDTTLEVLQASMNGFPIYSTFHAPSIETALEKICSKVRAKEPNAASILAESLAVIIFQEKEAEISGGVTKYRINAKCLILTGDDNAGIRAKIRAGNFASIAEDIDRQRTIEAYKD
ncbi:ATPase, T2SS/T4P/T4SS family [Pseudomonas sp. DCB_CB]|uniref:ATPase, T2SS/T4P/T4SS family n=1 Tax=unclassified Pseudomonas TaxID=196821 RepID=UPI0022488AD9|nr:MULTISPECIES: ATPase, T2SS/T4P/T4SS family [unclassified Pseudomonas]MCX2694506.1 ATPase, T2SS/T4P/T4SS family [Pseudomonas sp. DCB_BZ]MCX2859664.1 ATPase, T2SS/T4P/T4SS family [Pseudomonas sp. DCB_CB]